MVRGTWFDAGGNQVWAMLFLREMGWLRKEDGFVRGSRWTFSVDVEKRLQL